MQNHHTHTPQIDICIATYKRPFLLNKLVQSLINQSTNNLFKFSIIIVDNDYKESAKEIVHSQKNKSCVIRYYCQPQKNIALTRNMAVEKSNGEFIAFIDDDEYANELWLLKLYMCLNRYEADCVHGPVISYFPQSTSKFIIKSGFMNRKRFKTGTTNYTGSTNNCLIKSDVIKQFDIPFGPEFGITGGSDTDFFYRLYGLGFEMVWCDEAEVYEYVSPDRATFKWLLKRSFRGGNNHIIRKNKNENIQTRLFNLIISLVKFLIVLIAFPFCIFLGFFENKFWVRPITKLTEYCGQIAAFVNYQYKEYK